MTGGLPKKMYNLNNSFNLDPLNEGTFAVSRFFNPFRENLCPQNFLKLVTLQSQCPQNLSKLVICESLWAQKQKIGHARKSMSAR